MLLTEEQASNIICMEKMKHAIGPMIVASPDTAAQEIQKLAAAFMCFGSDCAMWRWGDHDRKRHNKGCGGHADPFFSGKCDCPRLGYCGLAGKP